MPIYFIVFLATLAASLLLYVGAVATVAITRRPPPSVIRGTATSPLLATGVALLWFSVGVGWLLFFNVYRIHVDMSALGDAAYRRAALWRDLLGLDARAVEHAGPDFSPYGVVDRDIADRFDSEHAVGRRSARRHARPWVQRGRIPSTSDRPSGAHAGHHDLGRVGARGSVAGSEAGRTGAHGPGAADDLARATHH